MCDTVHMPLFLAVRQLVCLDGDLIGLVREMGVWVRGGGIL